MPVYENIAEEIINNAIAAASEDYRFSPIEKGELDDLDFSVDILSEPVKADKKELDPKKYGVVVESGYKKGLLLPDLPGVNSVEEQLTIACQKAEINPLVDEFDIYKFTVERHV